MPRKKRNTCRQCGNEPARATYIYCSNACQLEYQYHDYVRKWKKGHVSGLQQIGVVSGYVKRYLREKYGNKCCVCGWAQINPVTGQVPLVADHIDGNWKNNTEGNLRLVCPNCDALSSTYAGLNRGHGRKGRTVSKRVLEGKTIAQRARVSL